MTARTFVRSINKWTIRTGIIIAIVAYFPVKIYWLIHYQPRLWVRVAVVAMFWGALQLLV
jgi:hypothetical protein